MHQRLHLVIENRDPLLEFQDEGRHPGAVPGTRLERSRVSGEGRFGEVHALQFQIEDKHISDLISKQEDGRIFGIRLPNDFDRTEMDQRFDKPGADHRRVLNRHDAETVGSFLVQDSAVRPNLRGAHAKWYRHAQLVVHSI